MTRDNEDGSSPLGAEIDLDAWEPQAPPADFASRVLAEIQASEKPAARPRRWVRYALAPIPLAAAAAALLVLGNSSPPARGEAIAKERIEVPLGKRALAVLEPGAKVQWDGDSVVQPQGDVFYRVEPGAKFTVHTPAGDVEVKGTCFSVKVRDMQKRDIKVAAVSTALSALAFVAVYEGKVAVSHASERVELAAGETGQTGSNGVKKTRGDSDGEIDRAVAAASEDADPQVRANQNLVRQIGDYRSRLETLAREKSELETKLEKSQTALSASQDGAPVVLKHDFDLGADDWKELAKDGSIKYQNPCMDLKGWTPSPERLQKLGLAPEDGATINAAYKRSSERLWATVKPLCTAAVGSADVAARLGPDTCISLILDTENARDREATDAARRMVGEIRAGARPMPGPNEQLNPVGKMFLAMTGSGKAFEDDLAQSFGPEEAHRLVYSDQMCMGRHHYGNSPKK